MRQHNMKEEQILYPMTQNNLPAPAAVLNQLSMKLSAAQLDVSELEAPEPMRQILIALTKLNCGNLLLVSHRMEPFPLYPKLNQRGFITTSIKKQITCRYFTFGDGFFTSSTTIFSLASFLLNNYLNITAIRISKSLTDNHGLWGRS